MERAIFITKINQLKGISKMYKTVWLALVDIEATKGNIFHKFLDFEGEPNEQYIGAW